MLDAFFAGSIAADDLELINSQYSRRMAELTEKIAAAEKQESQSWDAAALEQDIRAIVNGETASNDFYGRLLDRITAYPDRRVEVRLKLLPTVWTYRLGNKAASKDG